MTLCVGIFVVSCLSVFGHDTTTIPVVCQTGLFQTDCVVVIRHDLRGCLCGGECLNIKMISDEKSVCCEAFLAMKQIMLDAEKRYSTKLYLDSHVEFGKSILETCVFIHGDRNVVNIVCLKLINWQHRHYHRGWEYMLYAYPAEDLLERQ